MPNSTVYGPDPGMGYAQTAMHAEPDPDTFALNAARRLKFLYKAAEGENVTLPKELVADLLVALFDDEMECRRKQRQAEERERRRMEEIERAELEREMQRELREAQRKFEFDVAKHERLAAVSDAYGASGDGAFREYLKRKLGR